MLESTQVRLADERQRGRTFLAAVVVEGLMAESAPPLLPLCAKKAVICGGESGILARPSSRGHAENEPQPQFRRAGSRVQIYAGQQHRYGPFLRFSR